MKSTHKTELASSVKEYLPAQYQSGTIEFQTVSKSGLGEVTGMLVRTDDSVIAPCIYIDQAYSDYVKYKLPISEVAQNLGETLSKALGDQELIANSGLLQAITNGMTDLKSILPAIELKAVPVTGNAGYLSNAPHIMQGDMAAVCIINLGSNNDGQMSTKVTDELLNKMGISKEELFSIARENISQNNPIHIASMDRVMSAMMFGGSMFDHDTNVLDEIAAFPGIDQMDILNVPMFTMSNTSQMNGACSVFVPEVMDALSDKFPDGFYILPSSVHEVLIVPKSEDSPSLEELSNMVRCVNDEQVAAQDKLSDFVHEYDSAAKAVYIAGTEKPSLTMGEKEAVKETKKDKPSGR